MAQWQLTPYLIPMLIAVGISTSLAIYTWRHRAVPGATTFFWLMLAVAELSWSYTVTLANHDPSTKLFLAKLQLVGYVSLPPAWLAFALEYTNRQEWLARRRLALMSLVPLVTLLLVWTNEAHGLIWHRIQFYQDSGLTLMDINFGAWFWVHTLYSYFCLLPGTLLIVAAIVRSPHLYRRQATTLLVAVLIPWVGNVLYVFGLSPLPNLDLTPLAFTLTGLAIAWGLLRYRLFDLVPVARNAVVESMSDGMIVIDAQNRIVDLNPAMLEIAGLEAGQAVGRPVAEVLQRRRDLVERFLDASQAQAEVTLEREGQVRHYDLRISPLSDWGGRLTGRLVILRDISARVRAEEVLRQHTQELEISNAELDAFAHTVAHDLKTPLTTLVGFSKLLAKRHTRMKPERVDENLHIIIQTGDKMSNIINELLLLSSVRKVEQVEIGPLDMAAIVREALNRFADSIAETGAQVVLPDAWPAAMGYGPWVEEVWVNYISNALKYGGTPPRVELGATEQADGSVRFWVRDNGPGLTPDERARLFAQFTRLHQVRAEGHGLGLSIVQRIVEKLGGQVGVESDGLPGQGSLFYFVLPSDSE